jgi:glycosyltransferase involved in cell wall biosynthesis
MNKVGGPMRFHVVSLPHTNTTKDFTSCAFTEKVRRFCVMMTDLGHEVILYAGEQNEAPVTELVTCIYEDQRAAAVAGGHYTTASFDTTLPHWQVFNANVVREMTTRLQPKDFICLIGGYAHKPIADAFPDHMSVEFGIGYGGTFARYRVFESYAWMHSVYAGHKNPTTVDGNFFDGVINGYLEPEQFPAGKGDGDYYFFIGRLIERKGYNIAQEVCERLGKRLIIAGPGQPNGGYGEFIGNIGPKKRAELMGGAIALFAPTTYIEPFGNIVIEAQTCGTPTITTDWGAFTETNVHGVTGFRCRTLADFMKAAEDVKSLNRTKIRKQAIEKYSLEAIAPKYQDYFERLLTLWDDGWYQLDTEKAGQ